MSLVWLQVDIFQMCVLEFESRPLDDRFYHLEHYIDGRYIKYNSNSGFVEENIRCTPQVRAVAANDNFVFAENYVGIFCGISFRALALNYCPSVTFRTGMKNAYLPLHKIWKLCAFFW